MKINEVAQKEYGKEAARQLISLRSVLLLWSTGTPSITALKTSLDVLRDSTWLLVL